MKKTQRLHVFPKRAIIEAAPDQCASVTPHCLERDKAGSPTPTSGSGHLITAEEPLKNKIQSLT